MTKHKTTMRVNLNNFLKIDRVTKTAATVPIVRKVGSLRRLSST
tara:strand:+ start:615 stop:746 length:132 start_codon:yes stop_codon:yes gene_type:complete